MLQFKVKEILVAAGKKSPGTWLFKACGFTRTEAFKIINNKQQSINLEDFSKLCENLNCTPALPYSKHPRTTTIDLKFLASFHPKKLLN